MSSVDEKAPTSGAKNDLVSGPVFIGYGTKHVICNSRWATQTKTTESKGVFSSKFLPATSGCELVPTASSSKQHSLVPLQPKPSEAKNTYISVTQLPAYTGHTVQQTVSNNRQSIALQSELVVSEAKSIALLPSNSVQLSGPTYSLDLKVLMPEKSSALTAVPANPSSVAMSVVPDNISHFELIPLDSTVFMGANKPSNSPSGLVVEKRTIPQNSSRLVNISRQSVVNSNQVTGQQNAGRQVNVRDGDEIHTSEEMPGDDALAQNNNSVDVDAEDSLETKKIAARHKLNAALQSAVENQPVVKTLVNVGKCLAPRIPNLMSSRIILKPTSISKKVLGQTVAVNERPNGMKVRIENAKIVKVAECENNSFRIPSSAMQNIGVDVAQLRCADDIFRKGESPHLIIPPLKDNKELKEVIVETSTDPFSSKGMVSGGSATGGQTYVFEPLSISADTLVPVTGTTGLRERQNLKEIELMCKRQEQAQDVQDKEPDSSKESAAVPSSATVLRCFLCPYYHTKQTKIAKHWIQVHLTQRPYICPYCDRNYTTSYEAQLHVHKMHPGEKLTIAIKNSAHFASSLAYELVHSENVEEPNAGGETVEAEQPRYIHTNVLTFSCKKCDFRCTSALDLKAHLRSVHVRYKPHFCMYCTEQKRSFSCDFDLKQHIRRFHPERVPLGGRTFPESVIPALTADVDWASTYEAIPISGKVIFQCRSCTFRSLSPDTAWKHVLTTHEWPKEVKCPMCTLMFQLSGVDRQNCSASCSHCHAKMSLGPNSANVARLPEKGIPVFVCTPCEYKTMGKGSMNRHLKYNHTKCRPYACAYCNYSAVERPKIKSHIVHVHPDMEIDIRERTESNDAYRTVLSDLFKKIVKLEYTTDIPVSDMVAMDKERNGGKRSLEEDSDSDSSSNNVLQKRQRLDLVPNDSLNFANSRSTKLSAQAQERERKVTEGPHFLCMICGYKCIDRSCMSRHIKYMHLPTRPHSCPYCRYSNVEKTKVRLHVKANHPSLQRCVKTDKRILEQLSYEAKQYYIRVDARGDVMKDGSSATALARYSANCKSHQNADSAQQHDTPILNNELILTELDPQTDILDVQTEHGAATIVTKAGIFQVGIKEEPLDDVEIKQEPGLTSQESSQALELLTTSINALDHNYVIDLPPSLSQVSLSESNVTIKAEPVDTGYELSMENSLPLESAGFSGNNFVSSESSLGVTDEDDDDDDEDEDVDVDVDFPDVPFGASAFNPDGVESLYEDMEEEDDDDDDDDDDDLIDLKDIRLDGSDPLFVEMSLSKPKCLEEAVERDRLRMLSEVLIEEDVHDDPKIWMRTVVEVEDMLSRIHTDKPLLDL